MPSALMKSLAVKSGKSIEEVERVWAETSGEAEKKFEAKSDEFWAWVVAVTKRKLGL